MTIMLRSIVRKFLRRLKALSQQRNTVTVKIPAAPKNQPTFDLSAVHTLVVPTFNRPDLLAQLLRYYDSYEGSLRILVLDSSRPEVFERNAATIGALTRSAEHLRFPETMPMALKLSKGMDEVSTPYVSFCADDDIVFPEGLITAVSYLEEDESIAAAHGMYVSFLENGDELYVRSEYSGLSLNVDSPFVRQFHLSQRYESLFYAVCRAKDVRNIFEWVADIESLAFQELFQSMGLLLLGKTIRFTDLYCGRRAGPAAEPDRDRWQSYYWFCDDAVDLFTHYVDYRDRLMRFYRSQVSETDPDDGELRRIFDIVHMAYFTGNASQEYFYQRLQHLAPTVPFSGKKELDLLPEMKSATEGIFPDPGGAEIGDRYKPDPGGQTGLVWCTDLPALDQIAASTGVPRHARLPADTEWLGYHPEFVGRYQDFCRFLNFGQDAQD